MTSTLRTGSVVHAGKRERRAQALTRDNTYSTVNEDEPSSMVKDALLELAEGTRGNLT